jgi:hypothetical protein
VLLLNAGSGCDGGFHGKLPSAAEMLACLSLAPSSHSAVAFSSFARVSMTSCAVIRWRLG